MPLIAPGLLAPPLTCWVVGNRTLALSNSLYLSDSVPEWVGGKRLKMLLMRKPEAQKDEERKQGSKDATYILQQPDP